MIGSPDPISATPTVIVCEICGWKPSPLGDSLLAGMIGPLPQMISHALVHCFPSSLVEVHRRYREIYERDG